MTEACDKGEAMEAGEPWNPAGWVVDRIVWAAAWPLDTTWLPTDHSGLQEAGEGLLLVDARLAGWEG